MNDDRTNTPATFTMDMQVVTEDVNFVIEDSEKCEISSVSTCADSNKICTNSFDVHIVEPDTIDTGDFAFNADHTCTPHEETSEVADLEEYVCDFPLLPLDYEQPVNDPIDIVFDAAWSEVQHTLSEEREDVCVDTSIEDDDVQQVIDHLSYVIEGSVEMTQPPEEARDTMKEPLYNGARSTVGATMLLLTAFMIKFKLPDNALTYLLKIMDVMLPIGHKLMKSRYILRKFLSGFTVTPKIHYFCSFCYWHIDKNAKICTSQGCKKELSSYGSISYFIELPIVGQLSSLFKREKFCHQIRNNRFEHLKTGDLLNPTISDVYDGSVYQSLFKSGFLSNPNNISFGLNTDGVPIFKSSHVSMWPVYLLVNELPLKMRTHRENILFYGVWVGAKKPVMWSFLKPLYDELARLESGVVFKDHKNQEFCCQAALITCTCDLPARCLLTNSVQFNGSYSCWYCVQKGKTHTLDTGGICHVFPFDNDDPKGPCRTVESVKRDVLDSMNLCRNGAKNYNVNGIKGPFWFIYLKHYPVIDGIVIDYMHGLCGGVMKLLLNLWFKPAHKHQHFSMFSVQDEVNRRLLNIKPTSNISRVPRSLSELVHWKASEFLNFLLLWGFPVLNGLMQRDQLAHFFLLIRGTFLLIKEKISYRDLEEADACFLKFCQFFSSLYGERYITMNIHQLVHITDCVRATGPLFVNNCFVFEDLNGFIIRHIHGSHGAESQILNAVSLIQALPELHLTYVNQDSEEDVLFHDMMGYTTPSGVILTNRLTAIGNSCAVKLTEQEMTIISNSYAIVSPNAIQFNKLLFIDSNFVVSAESKKSVRRCQSAVCYSGTHYGSVSKFIQVKDNYDSLVNLALIHPFIYEVAPGWKSNIIAIPIALLNRICAFVDVGDRHYICEFPNFIKTD